MKKVSLLILLVILLSTVLMAAVPTKTVRLTIINKSGFEVYMKLTGSSVTDAFYYLTVPSGDQDSPEVKVFTIMSDVYDRETWQCNGEKSSGTLIVTGNLRLTFTPCGQMKFYCKYYEVIDGDNPATTAVEESYQVFLDKDICGRFEPAAWDIVKVNTSDRVAGEPTMEKVTYFHFLQSELTPAQVSNNAYRHLAFAGDNIHLYTGWWTADCATFWWRSRTYRTPLGCEWRYQY